MPEFLTVGVNILTSLSPGDDFVEVLELFGGDPKAGAEAERVRLTLFPHIDVLVDLVCHLLVGRKVLQ